MAFEGILTKPDAKPARWRKVTLLTSLALHLVGLAVGLVYSVWRVDEMPMPAIQVMLADAPPPPPPPPPPASGAKKSNPKPRPRPTTPSEIVQPKFDKELSKPKEKEHEAPDTGGVVGGVEGGVAGGVVGGVVGSDGPAKPPPPPPAPKTPQILSAQVGHHQLAVNPNSPPYCCVKVPRSLDVSGTSLTARLRVCVNADGQVNQVQILEGVGAAIDSQIPNFVRRWRYRPYLVDNQPSPFCYTFRYEMTVR